MATDESLTLLDLLIQLAAAEFHVERYGEESDGARTSVNLVLERIYDHIMRLTPAEIETEATETTEARDKLFGFFVTHKYFPQDAIKKVCDNADFDQEVIFYEQKQSQTDNEKDWDAQGLENADKSDLEAEDDHDGDTRESDEDSDAADDDDEEEEDTKKEATKKKDTKDDN
jgi:hypothetical protein